MSENLLIPVQVGFQRIDLTPESARLLVAAIRDYTDGDLPPDLSALCNLLSPNHPKY